MLQADELRARVHGLTAATPVQFEEEKHKRDQTGKFATKPAEPKARLDGDIAQARDQANAVYADNIARNRARAEAQARAAERAARKREIERRKKERERERIRRAKEAERRRQRLAARRKQLSDRSARENGEPTDTQIFLQWLSKQPAKTKDFFKKASKDPKAKRFLEAQHKKNVDALKEKYLYTVQDNTPEQNLVLAKKLGWPYGPSKDGRFFVLTPWGTRIRSAKPKKPKKPKKPPKPKGPPQGFWEGFTSSGEAMNAEELRAKVHGTPVLAAALRERVHSKKPVTGTATSAWTADKRREAAVKGQALPDGSYPIKDKTDWHKAKQALGRAKNQARVIEHLKKRAKTLGIPKSEYEGLTASVIERFWNPDLHPRGRDGKFIDVTGVVSGWFDWVDSRSAGRVRDGQYVPKDRGGYEDNYGVTESRGLVTGFVDLPGGPWVEVSTKDGTQVGYAKADNVRQVSSHKASLLDMIDVRSGPDWQQAEGFGDRMPQFDSPSIIQPGDRVSVPILDGTNNYEPTGELDYGVVQKRSPEGALTIQFDDGTNAVIAESQVTKQNTDMQDVADALDRAGPGVAYNTPTKFYVTQRGTGVKTAGPFDTQEEADAAAADLNAKWGTNEYLSAELADPQLNALIPGGMTVEEQLKMDLERVRNENGGELPEAEADIHADRIRAMPTATESDRDQRWNAIRDFFIELETPRLQRYPDLLHEYENVDAQLEQEIDDWLADEGLL